MCGSSTRSAIRGIQVISASRRRFTGSSEIKPKRAVLTHMHVDLDYAALARELPDGVEPAYDGMVLTTKDNIAAS